MVEVRLEAETNLYNELYIKLLEFFLCSHPSDTFALETVNLHEHPKVYWLYKNTIITVKEDTIEIQNNIEFHRINCKIEQPVRISYGVDYINYNIDYTNYSL